MPGHARGDEDWNAVRYDPSRPDHVESYFLKANDPAGDRALWIKATLFSSAREPERVLSEGWAIFFDRTQGARHVAVKETRPKSEATYSSHGLDIRWPDFSLTERATKGTLATKDHRISWDLTLDGELAPVVPLFHPKMYAGGFPKSKPVTPFPSLTFDGQVNVDGETHELRGWRGMQGHNWGRGHTDFYAWSHCNTWDQDEDLVLEAMSGRVRVGPIMTPMTTIVTVRFRGVAYDFTHPLELARARGDVTTRRLSFTSRSKLAHAEGVVEATTEDMVGLYYANPDGQMTYCLNSKLASARLRFEIAGREPVVLTSRAAALEIGTHDEEHGVTMRV